MFKDVRNMSVINYFKLEIVSLRFWLWCHTRHSLTTKNNLKASTGFAEWCWMLYVPM